MSEEPEEPKLAVIMAVMVAVALVVLASIMIASADCVMK